MDRCNPQWKHWYFFIIYFYSCFWLCWVFAAAQVSLLVVASRGYSVAVVLGLLIAAVSLVEHRLEGTRVSVVADRGL